MSDIHDFEPVSLTSLWVRGLKWMFRGTDVDALLQSPAGDPSYYDPETTHGQCRAAFEAAAGMDKDVFMALATQGLPDIQETSLTMGFGSDRFTIGYKGEDFSDSYSVNFTAGIVGSGDMINGRGDRTTGRRMFGLRAMSGLMLGFNTLGLNAGNLMGAFTWAKAGVQIDSTNVMLISRSLQERLAALRPLITRIEYNYIDQRSRLKNDSDLMDIALLSRKIENADIPWDELRRAEYKYADTHSVYVARGLMKPDEMTIGQFMLCGLSYDAHIDLTSGPQMTRVEAYTQVPIRKMAQRNRAAHLSA